MAPPPAATTPEASTHANAHLAMVERGGTQQEDPSISKYKLGTAPSGATIESIDDHHHLFPRHGDKWRATYHNVTAMLGAGVLGLPSTFAYLGWAGGVVSLLLFLVVSWYTFILLVNMHEVPPKEPGGVIPRRFNNYTDLCTYLLGPRKGWWAIVPFQTMVLYGTAQVYAITGGKNMMAAAHLTGNYDIDKVSYWILIFCAIQLLFCLVPNFSELGWVSLMGAVMSAIYSIIGTVLSAKHSNEGVNYKPGDPAGVNTVNLFFGIFGALSTVAFAFGGHNIAQEIQATLPAKPTETTVPRMMFSVHWAFVMTSIAYFAVSVAGFYAFGTSVPDNILDAISDPVGAITAAHLAVVLHVFASYQVYLFPLFDATETMVIQNFPGLELEQRNGRRWIVRIAIRWSYVAVTAFIGCLIPFFGALMNLIGAVAITPTTFVMPPILWLYWKRPSRMSFEYWSAMTCAIVMTIIGAVGSIAAVRSIILQANKFKPFT